MKKSRTFRISKIVDSILEKAYNTLGISKTSMIEISIIEKSQRMGILTQNTDEVIKCIDDMIKSLEKAKNRLK